MANAYQLRLKINYQSPNQSFGETEDYWLAASTANAAYAAADLICQYRVLLLGPGPIATSGGTAYYTTGPYIKYASMSRYGQPRDSVGISISGNFSFPNIQGSVATAGLTPPNDKCSAIEYGFIAPNGRKSRRMFRFISDAWETNIKADAGFPVPKMVAGNPALNPLPYGPLDPNGQPLLNLAATGNTLYGLQCLFLNVLAQNTGVATLVPAVSGPPPVPASSTVLQWGVPPGAKIALPVNFVGFSTHRTGKPYGDYQARAKKRI